MIQNVTDIEIRYNPKVPALQRPKVTTANDAYNYFLEILNPSDMNIREEAAALFLNRGNRVIGGYKVSSGGITGTVVDIRLILSIALKTLACGIILAHTHPSGELKCSKADMDITEKLNAAAKLMEIALLDHLIITTESFYSFADSGSM